MNHLAIVIALGLCAEPQDGNRMPAGPPDVVKLAADLKAVMERLDRMEQAIRTNNDNQNAERGLLNLSLQNQINELIKKVGEMRSELDGGKAPKSITSEKRTEPNTATVLLVNARLDMPMATMINGAMYHVEPNSNRLVSVPAGSLRLQIVATDQAARERTLLPGATHVVTLR